MVLPDWFTRAVDSEGGDGLATDARHMGAHKTWQRWDLRDPPTCRRRSAESCSGVSAKVARMIKGFRAIRILRLLRLLKLQRCSASGGMSLDKLSVPLKRGKSGTNTQALYGSSSLSRGSARRTKYEQ